MTQSEQNKLIKLNPFTQQILYDYSRTTLPELVISIQKLGKSFNDWKLVSIQERIKYLDLIIINYELLKSEIIYSEALDQGLSLSFTEESNYSVGLQLLNSFKKELSDQLENDNTSEKKIYSPQGLTAIFLSWNLSNRLFIQHALPALLAGNTVLVKCSSSALSTMKNWKNILEKSGLASELIQFVVEDSLQIKNLIVSHPGVKAICLTGRLDTAVHLIKNSSQISSKIFKKLQIKSGSKNSCLMLDEPNFLTATKILESALIGQGQLHWNSSRFFVLDKYQKLWSEIIHDYLEKITPANSVHDQSVWGPIVKNQSLQQYNQLIATAKNDQAKFIQGHSSFDSNIYCNPCFTYDMSNCSELQQDQLHFPLFILSVVKYGFDIPKYSNVSYYGDSAYIFGEKVAAKIFQELEVGTVAKNKWPIYQMEDPLKFSTKQSAYGYQDCRIFGSFNSNVKYLTKN